MCRRVPADFPWEAPDSFSNLWYKGQPGRLFQRPMKKEQNYELQPFRCSANRQAATAAARGAEICGKMRICQCGFHATRRPSHGLCQGHSSLSQIDEIAKLAGRRECSFID